MSHYGPSGDRIIVARLHGSATRHVHDKTPENVAVAELVEIATDNRTLRVDLLSEAAGTHWGQHQADPIEAWVGLEAARLLAAAGADRELAAGQAAVVLDRLRPKA